jgi:hypothetical protein
MKAERVSDLAARCRDEQNTRKKSSPSCFELFRLAFEHGDVEAWEAICSQFGEMVTAWVHRYPRFHDTGEEAAFFVNEAYLRFWQYGRSHAQSGEFSSLGQYLHYLRRCVWSGMEAYLRDAQRDAMWAQVPVETNRIAESAPMDEQLDAAEMLGLVKQITKSDPRDGVIVEESWINGLLPRHIVKKHPDLFPDVESVRNAKRNLLRRLKRNPRIAEFLKSMGQK